MDPLPGVLYNALLDQNMRLTPLQAAATNGHLPIVQLLLDNGAAVNRSTGVVPTNTRPSLPTGADHEGEDEPPLVAMVGGDEGGGMTALKCACLYAQVAVAEQLLTKGGALMGFGGTGTDGDGNGDGNGGGGTVKGGGGSGGNGSATAAAAPAAPGGSIFTFACNEGRQRGIRADELDRAVASLISLIPEPDRSDHLAAVDARGTTALHAACERKLSLSALSMIQVLTTLGADGASNGTDGADANEPDGADVGDGDGSGSGGEDGPVTSAASAAAVVVTVEQSTRQAQLRRLVDAANAKGATPLLLACQQALEETVRALVMAGADPRAADKHGRTPLAIATKAKARSPRHADIAAILEQAASEAQPGAAGV